MTLESDEEMNHLCRRIATEKGLKTFDQLVLELNVLLAIKHKRIQTEDGQRPRL